MRTKIISFQESINSDIVTIHSKGGDSLSGKGTLLLDARGNPVSAETAPLLYDARGAPVNSDTAPTIYANTTDHQQVLVYSEADFAAATQANPVNQGLFVSEESMPDEMKEYLTYLREGSPTKQELAVLIVTESGKLP